MVTDNGQSGRSGGSRRAIGFAAFAVALAVVVAVIAALAFPGDDESDTVAGTENEDTDQASDDGSSDDDGTDDENDASDEAVEPDEPDDGDTDESDETDDEDEQEPVPSELDDILPGLIEFVERERGLEFVTDPIVTVQDEDEFLTAFNELVDEDLAENRELYDQATETLQAVGFLAPDVSYEQAYRALAADGILGYYETELNELYVRGGDITPLVRAVIVHELVHALDDQHFELHRPEYDDRDDEVGFGIQALAEGNARRIENAYRATFSNEEALEAFAEAGSFSYDFSILELEFLNLILAPYTEGEDFVDAVLGEGGQAELDALFADPPVSSEQVVLPDRRGEPAVVVPLPPSDGEVYDSGTFGQITLQVLLEESIGALDAFDAGEGWGGDAYVIWLGDDGDSCLRVDFVADTADDLDEIFDGLNEWVGDADLASAEVVTVGSDVVRLTTCN